MEWIRRFSDAMNMTAEQFGLTIAEAAAYAIMTNEYEDAYLASINPATRGTATIVAKNVLKGPMIQESRRLAMAVTNHPGVDNNQRSALGLTLRGNTPTPIGPPTVMPKLSIRAVMGQVLELELRRQDGTTRRKPAGVRAARLYSFVGATPPSELEAWKFEGSTTKTLPRVTFPASAVPGTTVWVTAQWMSPTDEPGPACAPVQSRINYMGLTEAA